MNQPSEVTKNEGAVNARVWLHQEFANKKKRNPSYSLRAFSAAVGLSHPSVSQILSGKRPFTKKAAEKIADRLCLSPTERKSLLRSIEQHPRGTSRPDKMATDIGEYVTLEMDQFRVISDWHHYAILCVLDIEGSQSTPEWIGSRLGIPKAEAKAALDRLMKLGLIKWQNGRYRHTGKQLSTTTDISSPAQRKYHWQNLRKAEDSLEKDPVDVRDFSSITMAINPEKIPEANGRSGNFDGH